MKLVKLMRAYHSLQIFLPVSLVKYYLCMMSWGISQVCTLMAYETCETHAGLSLFTNISIVSLMKYYLCMMSWGISQVCTHRAYETCETHAGLSLFTNISTCESSEVLFMYDVLGDISSMHS